ncbi:MAG: lysine--tRNA ligase [Candidatus Binatia bacterium]
MNNDSVNGGRRAAAAPDRDDQQVSVRRAKLGALRESGSAFPNDFRRDSTCAQLRKAYGDVAGEELANSSPTFRLAGRVTAIRSFGKAGFLNLRDGSGDLQLFVKRGELDEVGKETVRGLDTGDIVGVEGRLFRTRTNELTLSCSHLRLLVKALRPLPEKWHGLTDVEKRYRQRYVDLIINEEVRATFRNRALIVRALRSFMDDEGFVEVETPMMQAVAGGAAARPFVTHHNALSTDMYLRVAPELYLKRLVVGGMEKVFELNRNFRNEGISTQHNPEFTMCEFYQAYVGHEELMDLTERLLRRLAEEVHGSARFIAGDLEMDFEQPYLRMTMSEAVAEFSSLSVEEASRSEPLNRLADELGLDAADRSQGMGVLSDVFERVVEPKLDRPTFITRFPIEVSPLSRACDDHPGFVERFELFIGGREIANGFSELNDPEEQHRRFLQQISLREAGDDEAHMMDTDYVRALEYGLPPTAGEGIGIDRLVMVLTGSPSIRDVILFPQLRPEARG